MTNLKSGESLLQHVIFLGQHLAFLFEDLQLPIRGKKVSASARLLVNFLASDRKINE